MRQFPRERGFLPVSSPWGCPRRWFRVKQGGSRSSAPEQGIFGEEPDPHPRHLHQTIFHLFKNKRKKSQPSSLPQTGARNNNCSGGHSGSAGLPPHPQGGFVSSPHQVGFATRSRALCPPLLGPLPAICSPIPVTLYSPSSTKAQQNHHIQKQHLAPGPVFFEQLQW